ncbi:MAG: hypothetical protein QGG54_08830, partial [Gammaproteobacteria bacterium]|nr:hypothetical protein [Gammaproteobacteria bacterium]
FELTTLPESYDNIESYGLQVAQLAGIPVSVIGRARGKLAQLEAESIAESHQQPASKQDGQALTPPGQGDLFGSAPHPAVDYLERLNPDKITAREALAILYELKNKTAR